MELSISVILSSRVVFFFGWVVTDSRGSGDAQEARARNRSGRMSVRWIGERILICAVIWHK